MHYFLSCKNRDQSSRDSLIKLTLRAMKLTCIMLFVMVMAVHAESRAQKVTLALKNAKLDRVFAEISKQTDYRFLYSDDVVNKSDLINLDVKSEEMTAVLDKLAKQENLNYKLIAGTVTVTKSDKPNVVASAPISGAELAKTVQQEITVTGVVRSDSGQPLAQASIVVKGVAGRGAN